MMFVSFVEIGESLMPRWPCLWLLCSWRFEVIKLNLLNSIVHMLTAEFVTIHAISIENSAQIFFKFSRRRLSQYKYVCKCSETHNKHEPRTTCHRFARTRARHGWVARRRGMA